MINIDLSSTNIFMKFHIRDESSQEGNIIFLYSCDKGVQHLETILKENDMFHNLLTPIEVLTKMAYSISFEYPNNQFTGISNHQWIGKHLAIDEDEREKFNAQYLCWKNQLEKFLGKENLFEVHIAKKELAHYESLFKDRDNQVKNEALIRYIEAHRVNEDLEDNLKDKDNTNKLKL